MTCECGDGIKLSQFLLNMNFHHSCVGATAIDAISAGYRTILIDDCCRGVDLKDIEHTKETVISSNGIIAHSKEVCLLIDFVQVKRFDVSKYHRSGASELSITFVFIYTVPYYAIRLFSL